jgi:hypothetical protein
MQTGPPLLEMQKKNQQNLLLVLVLLLQTMQYHVRSSTCDTTTST